MNKYIIQVIMLVDDKWKTLYHENITEQTNKEAMNVYVEHLTEDKKKAKRFYDEDEAVRIGNLFNTNSRKTISIKTVKK